MILSKILNAFRKKQVEPTAISTGASLSTALKFAELLRSLKPEEWPEAYVRVRYVPFKDSELYELAQTLEKDLAVHLVGLATLNASGFTRESALHALASIKHPGMLPYLLLRLNDWVQPVSRTAHRILRDNLPIFAASDFVKYFHLVESLERAERVDLNNIRKDIGAWMAKPANRPDLLLHAESGSTRERVFCFKVLTPVLQDEPDILRRAFRNSAPEVRTWAVQHLKLLPDWEKVLRGLFHDRSIRVRLKAVQFAGKHGGAAFDDALRELIFDDFRSIREVSRLVLMQHHVADLRSLYARALHSGMRVTEGVLAGYIETSDSSICNELLAFLAHDNPKIRAIALLGLAKLRYPDVGSECIKALMENNYKLRATAVEILTRPQVVFDSNALRHLPAGTKLPSRRAALKVLASLSRLEVVRDLLFFILNDEELRPDAYLYLGRRYMQNRMYPYFNKDKALKAEIERLGITAAQVGTDEQNALVKSVVELIQKFA